MHHPITSTILLPVGIIALFYSIYWTIRFPKEYFDCLMFKDIEKKDLIHSFISWAFVLLSIAFLVICTTMLLPVQK